MSISSPPTCPTNSQLNHCFDKCAIHFFTRCLFKVLRYGVCLPFATIFSPIILTILDPSFIFLNFAYLFYLEWNSLPRIKRTHSTSSHFALIVCTVFYFQSLCTQKLYEKQENWKMDRNTKKNNKNESREKRTVSVLGCIRWILFATTRNWRKYYRRLMIGARGPLEIFFGSSHSSISHHLIIWTASINEHTSVYAIFGYSSYKYI